MKTGLYHQIVLFLFLAFVSGCGGSGAANIAPAAIPQKITLHQNKTVSISLNGTDANNDELTSTIVSGPSHGSFSSEGVYTPDKDYYGEDIIEYKVNDGSLDSDIAQIKITIVDVLKPTLTIENKTVGEVKSVDDLVSFDFVFSEKVEGFTAEDIVVQGGTKSTFSGLGSLYHLTVIPDKNSNKPIWIQVLDGSATDLSGNVLDYKKKSLSQNVDTQRAFITVWKTDNPGGTRDNQIRFPIYGKGYDFQIDWGDGVVEHNWVIHTYDMPGIYTVKIKGSFPRIRFPDDSRSYDNKKLIRIKQWGSIPWETMNGAFNNCEGLIGDYTDSPDLSGVTDLSHMFSGASAFNQQVDNWDVSHVKNMSAMFEDATAFNQELNSWDTSNVTDMSFMFSGTKSFNQRVDEWNVSSLLDMNHIFNDAIKFNQSLATWNIDGLSNLNGIFSGASDFNQDLSGWNTNNIIEMNSTFKNAKKFDNGIGSWNTAKVKYMKWMFEGAKSFNQDISAWDTSKVISMNSLFKSAYKFDQDISAWDISSVEDMSEMFYLSGMNPEKIDDLKKIWPLLNK